jgi:hypothetical protein
VVLTVGGRNGVSTTHVSAVLLTMTVIQPTRSGSLTVYPHGSSRPTATSMSYAAGQTVANVVSVDVGADGKVSFYNTGSGTVHVVADLFGYYADTAGSLFSPLTATRILDTRTKTGVSTTTPVPAHSSVLLRVAGVRGVPASGVTAVSLNVTAIKPTRSGSLVAYADGRSRPAVNNVSFAAGQSIAGHVTVPMINGKIRVYNTSSGTVHVTADLQGYFSASKGTTFASGGLRNRPLDTRNRTGVSALHMAAGAQISIPIRYTGARAVMINFAATGQTASGSLTVYPAGTIRPTITAMNWTTGKTARNTMIVPVVNGNINFINRSSGRIDLIVDVFGYLHS